VGKGHRVSTGQLPRLITSFIYITLVLQYSSCRHINAQLPRGYLVLDVQ
jgi:hypothetical protein